MLGLTPVIDVPVNGVPRSTTTNAMSYAAELTIIGL